jgi:hypothetical protein
MSKLRVNVEKSRAPNYAEDKEFAQKIAEENIRDWHYTCAQRAEREVRWQDFYDMWNVGNQDPLNLQNYMGRANLHLPQTRKEIETMTRRLNKAFFPEDYLKADPNIINVDEDLAMCNSMLVRHYFDNVSHLKMKANPWIKQGVIYGTSPMRSYWRREMNEVYFKKRSYDVGANGELIPNIKKVKELVKSYDAPEFTVADIFQTWAYPVTATHPDQLTKVFHRRKCTLHEYKEMIKLGIAVDMMEDLEEYAKEKDEQYDQTQQRLQAMGESGELQGHRETKLLDLLEVWGRMEIEGKMMSYVQYIIGNTANFSADFCIRLQQNPYWHQKPNFDWMRYILAPGPEFYGRGLPEASQYLQHQLDDVLNQGMDSNTLALNSITIVNPAYAPNVESFEIEPNAIWWAAPEAVKNFQFPDLNEVTMKSMQILRGVITEMSDNSPQLPDPLSGKARSTGQADLAMSEWQTDLYSFVEQIILEGLLPLAEKTHMLLQDNLKDDDVIKIVGRYAGQWVNRIVTPDDIMGKMAFSWMGAVQIQNESVRTQQMLQFLKIAPMLPPSDDYKILYGPVIMELLRKGFNVKTPEAFVESSTDNLSIPPWIENKLMNMASVVKINARDEDDVHIQSHIEDMAKSKDPVVRSIHDKHIQDHKKQMQEKQQAQAQQQEMQQLQMNAQKASLQKAAVTGDPPAPHHTPEPHGAKNKSGIIQQQKGPNPNGNQGQIPASTDAASFAKGVRP